MTRLVSIPENKDLPTTNIARDTIDRKKQALFFVGTKAAAEKTAEEIAHAIKKERIAVHPSCQELKQRVLSALSPATKQCQRLAACLSFGIAFHHAGLVERQKKLIEEAFRTGIISIIVCTPTLAMGVDLPAYRTIIRDLKRFSPHWGSTSIPVLEYHQMAGRAGRPGKDEEGEAITIAKTTAEKDAIYEEYVMGEVEDIYSKLAVEPVLRTYLLSMIATEFVATKQQLIDFFTKTFWAHQYRDLTKLETIISRMLQCLVEWGFLQTNSQQNQFAFLSAADLQDEKYCATRLGKRVAELYIDPLTAHHIVDACRRVQQHTSFPLLHLLIMQLELRPLLRIKVKEYAGVEELLMQWSQKLLLSEPATYDPDYDDFLRSIKTTHLFQQWIEEASEDTLLKDFDIRPGELHAKKERLLWLLYSAAELAKIQASYALEKECRKLHMRIAYGVKEELLPLLRLQGIGRIRARRLYNHHIKDLNDIRKVDLEMLAGLIGKAVAISIKKQVGVPPADESEEEMKDGQKGLMDFR